MNRRWTLVIALLIVAVLIGVFLNRSRASPASQAQAGTTSAEQAHVPTQAQPQACSSRATPLGALLPAVPVWCGPITTGPPTAEQAANSWLDEFNHGLHNADIGPGYRVFEAAGASVFRSQHFRHNDHWMVDVAGQDASPSEGPYNFGGAVMRPDRSFRFVDGTLVVEFDVAAGIAEYGGNAWPEVMITTAPAPTRLVDDAYAYGIFGGHWTAGCRLQSSREPICALYDDTGRTAGAGGRVWEISHFQCGNQGQPGCDVKYGGEPFSPELDAAWHVCEGTDPDTNCRDRFRWELSKDRLTLSVNGVRYMEHSNFARGRQLPDALLQGEVYVYFGSWIHKPDADTVRFHWDRIAINPERPGTPAAATTAPSGTVPSETKPQAQSPPDLPSPGQAATPGVITFDDRPGQNQVLSGQYPSGVIDWGSDQWYHSGPWRDLATKSVSFNQGRTSAAFTFVTPRRLVRLDAYNGGDETSTVSLACAGQPTTIVTVAPASLVTIETGWAGTCRTVTVGSSNGWDTNFDTLVHDDG